MTPLDHDGMLDVPSLERMFERNLRHGVSGFFLLGTMGEGLLLPSDRQAEVVEQSCRIIGDRAEILANISDFGLERTFANIERFRRHPVHAYVFQFPAKSIATVNDPVDYLLRVADRVDRPLYYYHIPSSNNCPLCPAQLRKVLSHPRLKGLKNSSNDLYLRRELLLLKRERPELLLFEGQEWSIDEAFMLGCDGALCGMVPLGSRPMVGIARAAEKGDWVEATRLQEMLIDIYHAVYGEDLSTIWIGQKYALFRLGIFSGFHTIVHRQAESLTDMVKKRIDACLEKYRTELEG
jgi:dihydrodipicolinate synthase/N-acetylneuraminate lyase